MHFDFSLLEISFELLLFSLFAYKVYDLGKAYLVPLLYQTLTEEKNMQTEFFEKEKLLISTHHRLENQINQQQRTITLLEKKVQAWHARLEIEKSQLKRDEAIRLEHLKTKRIAQQAHLANAILIEKALPSAIQASSEKLSKQYRGDVGKQQLCHFINLLLATNTSTDHERHS